MFLTIIKCFYSRGSNSTIFNGPLNLLKNGKADYAITGAFSKKAAAEAKKYGDIHMFMMVVAMILNIFQHKMN